MKSHTDDQTETDDVNSFCVIVTKYLRETIKGGIMLLILSMISYVHSIKKQGVYGRVEQFIP